VRQRSVSICAPLSAEDAQIQSMPDASPAKWHLAHTTWFFESFVLGARSRFAHLYNSYYDAIGERVARDRRGLVSRPALADVMAYRAEIDARVVESACDPALVELGLHHEQQHQELLLTDIKHALGTQPLRPAYRKDLPVVETRAEPMHWIDFDGGVCEIGAGSGAGFAFDCERPRHRTLLAPFRLASRPISNAEVIAFIADGGYREPRLWLADGWAYARAHDWTCPLYWERADDAWLVYTLGGVREVAPAETACHLSYYEADAIARWAGARLPTEFEWERAAQGARVEGNFADNDRLHPGASESLFGDVWQWTQSAFAPYPGFSPLPGALGEYNGKFMCGQLVLRGGSCLTARDHVRASYRNFFAPHARWQMTGARLALDGGKT
jgi:ergothioneine biosynthesis protein EgtB